MGEYFNERLLFEPINWLIVGVFSTIWLIAFHVVMKGFSGMQGNAAPQYSPGLTPPPLDTTGTNAPTSGNADVYNWDMPMSNYSEIQARYPEDGSVYA